MMKAEEFESRSRAGEDDLTDAVMEASQIFVDDEEQSRCSLDQLNHDLTEYRTVRLFYADCSWLEIRRAGTSQLWVAWGVVGDEQYVADFPTANWADSGIA